MSRVLTSSLPILAILAGTPAVSTASDSNDTSTGAVLATHLATARVTRADARTGRLTLLTDGRTVIVETDAESPSIRGLRAGTPVVVGYRAVRVPSGRERRVLVSIVESSPATATRMAAASTSMEDVRSARVVHVDPQVPVISVEEGGTVHVLSASPATVPTLRVLQPGDTVNVAMGRMAGSNVDVAVRIDRLAPSGTARVEFTRPTVLAAPQPWTTTVAPPAAPPATGGIPLSYVLDSIPSIPPPAPTPQMVLPSAGVTAAPGAAPADVHRLQALQHFEFAAAQLAQAGEILDRAWAGHRDLCINGPAPSTARTRQWFLLLDGGLPDPDRDDCRTQRAELTRMAMRLRDQVLAATDAARAADVPAGHTREILARYRLDM
jgi:hypothetical protein